MATTNLITVKSTSNFRIQYGNGSPNHTSPKGSQYADLDTSSIYTNDAGGSLWTLVAGGSPTSLDADAFPTFDTAVVLADLNLIIADLEALPVTAAISGTIFNDTLTAGVYTIAGAATINGTLTLDGTGTPDAVFVIIGSAAISLGASANIVLINTLPENVHFLATDAFSLGAGAIMNGNMISKAGAPSAGAGCTIIGRMLTLNGAVSADSTSLSLPTGASFNIDYRSCTDVIMFTGVTTIANTGASSFPTGGIASDNGGAITGFGAATGAFTIYPSGISIPPQNNYLPVETGGSVTFPKANVVYIFPSGAVDFTGFDSTGIGDNHLFLFVNLGVGTATLIPLSPDSDNDNKIAADAPIAIKQYQSKEILRRNATPIKWLVEGNN
jgi:hypothetical protein